MIPHVLLSLLLVSPLEAVNAVTEKTYDLRKMTWADAKKLEGKRVRVAFVAKSMVFLPDGETMVLTEVGEGMAGDAARLVRFSRGNFQEPRMGALKIEGVIKRRIFPARIFAGQEIPEYHQIEVIDAKRVWP